MQVYTDGSSLDPADPAVAQQNTISLCGDDFALDAPTGFLRQQGVRFAAAGKRPASAASGSGEGGNRGMYDCVCLYVCVSLSLCLSVCICAGRW